MKFHAPELISAIPDGLVYVDLNGVIQFVNPAMHRLTGRLPKDLPGRSISVLFPEETFSDKEQAERAGEAHNLHDLLCGEKEGWFCERTIVHQDGHPIPV